MGKNVPVVCDLQHNYLPFINIGDRQYIFHINTTAPHATGTTVKTVALFFLPQKEIIFQVSTVQNKRLGQIHFLQQHEIDLYSEKNQPFK